MRHLFVIRHGDHNWEDLSNRGRDQIEKIAEEIKAIVGEIHNGHYLLSSTAPRAEQSAQIIAKAFGLEVFDKDERLWTSRGDDLYQKELEAIDGMIAPHKDKYDIVTIVTHYEVVGSYPLHVVKTLFGKDESIRRPEKGEGVHLDIEARTYQLLPRD